MNVTRGKKMGGYMRILQKWCTTCLLEHGWHCITFPTCHIWSCVCHTRNGQLTHTWHTSKSQFLITISRISSHLSPSLSLLYYHWRTCSDSIHLYLFMPHLCLNTNYSIYRIQDTLITTYTKYWIYWVPQTPSTVYTKLCIHQLLLTPSTTSFQQRLTPTPTSRTSLTSHLSVDFVVLNPLCSHKYR